LITLDEPTNGLDPVGMQDVRRLIGEIARDGRTILVSSHLLSGLEQVSDWLIVIDHGGLVHLGTPESLAGAGEALVLRTIDPAHTAAELNRRAHTAGIIPSELHYRRADLETRYLNLVNHVDPPHGG
jgi:ABC-2 type transport system ATP-binding protein